MNKSEEFPTASEDYKIMSVLSGQILDRYPAFVGETGGVQQQPYSGQIWQKWRLIKTGGDYYEIESRQVPYYCLDVNPANNAIMSMTWNKTDRQKWSITKNDDDTYTIRNKETNLVIASNGCNIGGIIFTKDYSKDDQNQKWHIDPAFTL